MGNIIPNSKKHNSKMIKSILFISIIILGLIYFVSSPSENIIQPKNNDEQGFGISHIILIFIILYFMTQRFIKPKQEQQQNIEQMLYNIRDAYFKNTNKILDTRLGENVTFDLVGDDIYLFHFKDIGGVFQYNRGICGFTFTTLYQAIQDLENSPLKSKIINQTYEKNYAKHNLKSQGYNEDEINNLIDKINVSAAKNNGQK